MKKKIRLPKVDPTKVRKLNEGVDNNSIDKYMIIVFSISILIILSFFL